MDLKEQSLKSKSIFNANDAILLDSSFSGINELLNGKVNLNPQNFFNLCNVVEAVVLHSTIYTVGIVAGEEIIKHLQGECVKEIPSEEDDKSIIFNTSEIEYLENINLERARDLIDHISGEDIGPLTIQWGDQKDVDEAISIVLSAMVKYAKDDTSDEALELKSLFRSLFKFLDNASELSVPFYGNVLEIPLMYKYNSTHSMPIIFYNDISNKFKVNVEDIYATAGVKVQYIPPLTALLLDRCKTREDIPEQLLLLRQELSALREIGDTYTNKMEGCESLSDKMALMKEYQMAWNTLIEKLSTFEHNKIIHNLWDIIKPASPLKILAEGINNFIIKMEKNTIVKRVGAYCDLWNSLLEIKYYENLIRNVFKEDFDNAQMKIYKKYAKDVDGFMFNLK